MKRQAKPRTGSDKANVEPQAMTLARLVGYQKNAVVSHTISDRKTGTLTIFSFDKGQGLSEHTAPFDAIVYIVDGEAAITISGKPYPLKAGQLIVMPAGQPHALRAQKKFKMLLIMIRS